MSRVEAVKALLTEQHSEPHVALVRSVTRIDAQGLLSDAELYVLSRGAAFRALLQVSVHPQVFSPQNLPPLA